MLSPFRTFTNKIGSAYNALKTSVIYAEDMLLISTAFGASVWGLRRAEPFPSVASDPTTPVFSFNFSPTDMDARGNSLDCEFRIIADSFTTGDHIKIIGDSTTLFDLEGDPSFPAGSPIILRCRLVHNIDDRLLVFVDYMVEGVAFKSTFLNAPPPDWSVSHSININLEAANDNDLVLVYLNAKVNL